MTDTERHSAQQILRETEELYRNVVERANDGICIIQDKSIKFLNRQLADLVGYSVEEGRNTDFADYLAPDQVSRVVEKYELMMTGVETAQRYETTLIHKKGHRVEIEVNSGLINYGDHPAVLVFVRDITERKRADENLQLLSSIAKQSTEGIALFDMDGNLQFINDAAAKMHGYTPEEVVGKNLSIFHTEEQMPAVLDANRQLRELGSFNGEIWHLHRSGSVFPTMMSNSLLRDRSGKAVAMMAFMRDISAQKRAEEALLESEERYRLLINNAGYPITVVDRDGRVTLLNSTGANNLGGKPEDFVGKHLYEIFPKRLAAVLLKRHFDVLETGAKSGFEDLMELPSGKHWFYSNLQPAKDAKGNTTGVQIISHDITDRKLAEEELRSTHDKLNATLNALPDLLFEVDRDGHILDFRAPKPDLLYLPPGSFLGKRVTEVLPKTASTVIMAAIDEAAQKGQYSGAVYSLTLGEETRWFELSFAARGDRKGPKARFTGLVRDITDRKRSEDMLRETTQQLRTEREVLREKNIALKQILDHIENEKQQYQRQVFSNLQQAFTPFLAKIRRDFGETCRQAVEEIETTLNSILSKDLDEFRLRYARLTSRQSQICEMVRRGMSSKQISEELNLSLLTVLKHREQIRKKLGITNKRISLVTYLRLH